MSTPIPPRFGPPIVALLDRALARLGPEIIAALHEAGFTDARPGHGTVMAHLAERDGMRLGELAARAGVSPQAMGELVDRMESLGYVERRPDPSDRRAKLIHVAERGHAGSRVTEAVVRAQEAGLRRRLGAEGYGRLRELLAVLAEPEPEPASADAPSSRLPPG